MKVGLVHRSFWKRPLLRDWADQLEAAGHQVIVFSDGVDAGASTPRRRYVPVPMGRGVLFDRAGLVFALRLYQELRNTPIDALLCIDSTAYFGAWAATHRRRVPAVMRFQGWIHGKPGIYPCTVEWTYKLAVQFCARWAPIICCLSEEIYDGLLARGASADRLWMAPNCVDHERWRAAKTGVHSDGWREVLYVGGFRKEKGIDVLLEAIPHIVERFPKVRFRVLGGEEPEDGPYHRLARRLGVVDRIEFGGFVARDELPELFASADLLVSPSRAEGHAVAVLECLACGTPVVASDISGLRESVRHEVNGMLVPPSDPAALADAIVSMLSDGALLERLSRQARPSVAPFSWSERLREFAEITVQFRRDGRLNG